MHSSTHLDGHFFFHDFFGHFLAAFLAFFSFLHFFRFLSSHIPSPIIVPSSPLGHATPFEQPPAEEP